MQADYIAYPRDHRILFSPEDEDLLQTKWTVNSRGYAVRRRPAPGVTILAQRVVMERVTGRTLGRDEICDHINGNKSDNRRVNLRLTTHTGNAQNCCAKSPLGLRGVTFPKDRGRWRAAVKHQGKKYHLGYFDSALEAAAAAEAGRRRFGFLSREP